MTQTARRAPHPGPPKPARRARSGRLLEVAEAHAFHDVEHQPERGLGRRAELVARRADQGVVLVVPAALRSSPAPDSLVDLRVRIDHGALTPWDV